MDESEIKTLILSSLGIPDTDDELILKEKIHSLSSDAIIRIKNLMDFHKKGISSESYKKYTKFLNEVLKVKRALHINSTLITCTDAFDPKVLPNFASKVLKINHGMSIWALSLKAQLNNYKRQNNSKFIRIVLSKLLQRVFLKITAGIFLKFTCNTILQIKLKNLLLKKRIKNSTLVKRCFSIIASRCKARKSTFEIKENKRNIINEKKKEIVAFCNYITYVTIIIGIFTFLLIRQFLQI